MWLVFGHTKLCVVSAQLQPCWHMLSAKKHFSSVDETKRNSVGSPVCLCGQSKLEKLWLDVFAQQYWKIEQDKWNGFAPFLCFMGWRWKSLRHPPKVNLDGAAPSFPNLLPSSCIARVVTATNQSCLMTFPSGIPPASPFRRQTVNTDEKLKMEVASAIWHPDAGYNWLISTVVIRRLRVSKTMGWICWFNKEKSKYRL